MAEIKVKVRKPLSKFLGPEGEIKDIKDLELVTRKSSQRRDGKVYFPGIAEFVLGENSFRIEMLGKNRLNTKELLDQLITAAQQIHEETPRNDREPMVIEFRYKNFSAQFLSGHLEKDKAGEPLPMHAVVDAKDNTMIRRMRVLRKESFGMYDAISDYYLQPNETIGIFGKTLKHKEEDVARALGFNIVAKESEGIVPNGQEQQKCKATRVCIHSEEYQANEIKDKALETFGMVKKLRDRPSFALGIKYDLEINADEKAISVRASDVIPKNRFFQLVEQVLRCANVKNLNSAEVEYVEKRFEEDSHLAKTISAVIQKVSAFIKEKQEKISFALAVVGFPLIFALFYLLEADTLFETAMKMLPAIVITAWSILASGEKKWFYKIAMGRNTVIIYLITALAEEGTLAFGFKTYLILLGVFTAIIIAIYVIFSDTAESLFNKLEAYISAKVRSGYDKAWQFFEKPTVIRVMSGAVFTFFILLTIAMIAMAIAGLLFVPIVVLAVLSIIVFGSITAALLDKRMWNEIARERKDKRPVLLAVPRGQAGAVRRVHCQV